MTLFWFFAGVLSVLAVLAALGPWMRARALLGGMVATPRRAMVVAAVLVATIGALYGLAGQSNPPIPANLGSPTPLESDAAMSFSAAAKILDGAADNSPSQGGANAGATGAMASTSKAGSMDTAIANLEARLSKGGGTASDWELLAKSFEFLGRGPDAAQARAHQLPPLISPSQAPEDAALPVGSVVSGEVLLDGALRGRVAMGETLFIVAKSVDSPEVPVAVMRASVGKWPVKFRLDDSQSMMPGHNLSSAGRVTVEARISHTGQPMPLRGDLQGTSLAIDPADHKALTILIDHVIS